MITTTRAILVAKQFEDLNTNYEAIFPIKDLKDVKEIWKNNKTPIIEEENMPVAALRVYKTLDVPEFIFGSDDFIAFCHRNGIECGEYRSKKKYDTRLDQCFLCGITTHMGIGGTSAQFNALCKEFSDMIIYESENFFVKIELGCMTLGMLMICPKEHILSAAQIPDDQMAEYELIMKDVEYILKSVYGKEKTVIFFEHGSAPSGFSSHQRSIVHAHTHVAIGVPFEEKYLDMVCVEKIDDVRELKKVKYFSYQEGATGQLYAVSDPNVYVQRQYPRQIIGMMLGIPNELTNWRKEPFNDNMMQTFRDLHAFLSDCCKVNNERIKKATKCFVDGFPQRTEF